MVKKKIVKRLNSSKKLSAKTKVSKTNKELAFESYRFPLSLSVIFLIGFFLFSLCMSYYVDVHFNWLNSLLLDVVFSVGVFVVFFASEFYCRKHHIKDSFDVVWMLPLVAVISAFLLAAIIYLLVIAVFVIGSPLDLLTIIGFYTLIAMIFVALVSIARALSLLRVWNEEEVLKKK